MTAEPTVPEWGRTVAAHLAAQDGVLSREQLLAAGCRPHDAERMLRRRELFVALPGVYVVHNGPRTWQQRAWVAVLACWPAALAGRSALRAENGPGLRDFDETSPIEVAVDVGRTVRDKPGLSVRRMAGLSSRVRANASPPRVRYEEAVLDVVAGLSREWDVIECCAAAVRSRCTTAARLSAALAARSRFPRRAWLLSVLSDIASGTASVLEHGYLHRVERAHALPRADRQRADRVSGGRIYRDATYPSYDLEVELDGRLDHSALADRDRDLGRDLETAVGGSRTVRLGGARSSIGRAGLLWPSLASSSAAVDGRADALLAHLCRHGSLTRSSLVHVTSELRPSDRSRDDRRDPDSGGVMIGA